jgi:hypothetical protein
MSRLIGPALAAAVFHVAVLIAYAAAFHGDLSALVCVARERLGQPPYEFITTGFPRNGYDGQFYYAIARAPWRRQEAGIDYPAARQARILYPALSWLLSGGDARRLLWVMPLINLLAIAGLAGVGAAAARAYGLNPWWGVLLPFAVNAAMPLLRDLTDILSTLSVAALLMAWLRRWPWWAATLCAVAAVFSREQNFVVVFLVLFFAFRSPERDWRWLIGLLAALFSWSLWLGVLWFYYRQVPSLPTSGNLDAPLSGMIYRWTHLAKEFPPFALFHFLCLTTLILQLGLAIWLLGKPGDWVIRSTALAGGSLAVIGGMSIYGDSWSYPRVFAWLPLGVWLACVQLRWRWPLVALSTPALLPLAVLVHV